MKKNHSLPHGLLNLYSNFNIQFHICMHKNSWGSGLRPEPRWGSLRRSPRPPNRICSGASHPRPRAHRALASCASRTRSHPF